MNTQLSDLASNTATDSVTALSNGGFLGIYDGAQPANANIAITTQNLLVTFSLGSPAFGPASAGVATVNAGSVPSTTVSITGIASWFRIYESDDTTVLWDGDVSISGADLNLVTVNLSVGDPISLPSFDFSVEPQTTPASPSAGNYIVSK